ncbi:hypothetical protein IU486_15855 [Streptomyces gardneri]|nr:hypothetical protein [Streptomyces gardneri]
MTLILSAVTRGFVFHASDRLFTIKRRGSVESWDPKANKTLVVVGDDCWLVLGYTGLAYLDGKPTDQFLAEAISGIPDLSAGGMRLYTRPPGLHYAAIIQRIVEAVSTKYEELPPATRAYPLIVAGTGIQLTRPRNRELTFRLGFSDKGYDGGLGLTERYPSIWRYSCIPAGDVNYALHEKMRERLRSSETLDSPESFRKILVDGVQETAAQSEYVGDDVISVVLNPATQEINVHFDRADPSQVITPGKASSFEGDMKHRLEVYTPYVLLPRAIFSPSVASVGGWCGSDGISYRFIGPAPDVGGGFYGSYARKPQPR